MLLCSRNWPAAMVFSMCFLFLNLPVQAQQPSFYGSFPRNGSENIIRNVFISVVLELPNGSLDMSTLTEEHIQLFPKNHPEAAVPVFISFIPDLRNLVVEPYALLEANTTYRFQIGEGVKDQSGKSFIPYHFEFTTGEKAYRKLVSMDRPFGDQTQNPDPIDHSGLALSPPPMRKAIKHTAPKPEPPAEPLKPERSRQELLALVLTFYHGVKLPEDLKAGPIRAPEPPLLPPGLARELPYSLARLDEILAQDVVQEPAPVLASTTTSPAMEVRPGGVAQKPETREPILISAATAPEPSLLSSRETTPIKPETRQTSQAIWQSLERTQGSLQKEERTAYQALSKLAPPPPVALATPSFLMPVSLSQRPFVPDWTTSDNLLAKAGEEESMASSPTPTPTPTTPTTPTLAEAPTKKQQPAPEVETEARQGSGLFASTLQPVSSEYLAQTQAISLPITSKQSLPHAQPVSSKSLYLADSLLWAIAATETLNEVKEMAMEADRLLAEEQKENSEGSNPTREVHDYVASLKLNTAAGERMLLKNEQKAGKIGISQTAIFKGKHIVVDFELPGREFVSFVLRDAKGEVFRTEGGYVEGGKNSRAVLLTDVPAGTYYAVIETIHQQLIRKITILD